MTGRRFGLSVKVTQKCQFTQKTMSIHGFLIQKNLKKKLLEPYLAHSTNYLTF